MNEVYKYGWSYYCYFFAGRFLLVFLTSCNTHGGSIKNSLTFNLCVFPLDLRVMKFSISHGFNFTVTYSEIRSAMENGPTIFF